MQYLTFYEMAQRIVGELPPESQWIYSLVCVCLIFAPFMLVAFVIGRFWK